MPHLSPRFQRRPNLVRIGAAARGAIAAILVSCRTDSIDPHRAGVASVVVTPSRLSVGVGASVPVAVEVRDGAGMVVVGRKVAWASRDPSVATVSSTGVVTGVAPGPVQIAATAEGKSAIADVTVTPKAVVTIRLTPNGDQQLLVGQTRQMIAQTLDADGNELVGRAVTWSSSSATVASVSNTGLITAIASGGTVITAASEGRTNVLAVTVTPVAVAAVRISPSTADLTVGQTAPLAAVATDAAGNVISGRPVSWTSGAPSIATVSATGVVTGIGAGSAVVFATIDGKTGSATINVRRLAVTSVGVAPTSSNLAVGAAVQLTATVRSGTAVLTDRVVGWSSSNEAVALVSSTGRVTGLKAGTVTITAMSEGVSGTAFVAVGIASIVVTPSPTSVLVGQTRQLTAVARDASNATVTGVTFEWSSSLPSTATVDGSGVVSGVAPGSASIRATIGAVSGAASVSVTIPAVATVTVSPSAPNVSGGNTVQLTATLRDASGNVLTGRAIEWTSANTARATVNNSGLVTTSRTNKGTVTITATSEGKSGSAIVTVK